MNKNTIVILILSALYLASYETNGHLLVKNVSSNTKLNDDAYAEKIQMLADSPRRNKRFWGSIYRPILKPFQQVGNAVGSVVNTASQLVGHVVKPVANVAAHIVKPISAITRPILKPINAVINPILKPISNILKPILKPIDDISFKQYFSSLFFLNCLLKF